MEEAQKQAVAERFVEQHKNFDVDGAGGLQQVYMNLVNGHYGEVRVNEIIGGHELEVEISNWDTRSGNSQLFHWEDAEYIAAEMDAIESEG